MDIKTKVIHAGIHPDSATGAIMTPIYQTSTYVQDSPGKHKGYEYSRTQNPTRHVLEKNLAALENTKHGLCFSSGMAAADCVIKLLSPGDHVLCSADVYGGTYRIFKKVYERLGIQSSFVDFQNQSNIEQYIQENTKMIWIETPSNPMLQIIDIKKIAQITNQKKLLLVIDNTFATPYLQQPAPLGADIILHSVTKYLGGHSDVVMGALCLNDDGLYESLAFYQNSCGATPGPFDSFLTLRGIKTLALRMERHSENAMKIAHYLQEHAKIDQVYYPGLKDHPGHQTASSQMRLFGGMLSFTLKEDTLQSAFKVVEKLRVFKLAESLGGVESLAGHPATMTHASIPKEERIKTGVKDSLIRLSVGIEDIEDLQQDLEQALS